MTKDRTINILWTGGMDSTFRVVELSRRQCTIQPYYILIGVRKSFRYELNAIEKISEILRKDNRTQAKISDPIIVEEKDIPRDADIFDSWFRLMRAKSWQYYLFAKYASQQHLEMEMGIQFSPNGSVAENVDDFVLELDVRQLVVLVAVAEVARVFVQVKNAVVLVNDRFLRLAGRLGGDNVQLLGTLRHHAHKLDACADGRFARGGRALQKVCGDVDGIDKVDIFLRQRKPTLQDPHRRFA